MKDECNSNYRLGIKMSWQPYCFEQRCKDKHEKCKPTHGACCTCQDCGQSHDECICRYFEEPCLSCVFK